MFYCKEIGDNTPMNSHVTNSYDERLNSPRDGPNVPAGKAAFLSIFHNEVYVKRYVISHRRDKTKQHSCYYIGLSYQICSLYILFKF